ncbi:3-oxoacid CoA-transferase subunit B [Oceanobacillus rekensis]|uniref:3-oxoacid CoA-transferase subunit B n=1 Tax=Oceanobacillus rekensis TaxID=937927 RepID=UPI001C3DE57C|nr:3-oxoacid CoA-transferase subunit B [Oceanobacillus rekensis]
MTVSLSKIELQQTIAKRVAKELKGSITVNLGVGIPTLVPKFIEDPKVHLHTENGLLGVTDVKEEDPNLVNASKLPVGEAVGASYFDSAGSFGMIRGGHVDMAILGALQADETGQIANWAVPGKNIIGVGGAMDLLVGAKKVIVAMSHASKDGESKIMEKLTYPKTSNRSVDMIITDLAVFEVRERQLYLLELAPGISVEEVQEKTEANFIVDL